MTIIVVPPGLYFDCYVRTVSDVMMTYCIDFFTCGLLKCRFVSDRPTTSMLNFLIESHTSSSVVKLNDSIPFTLWPNILVSDPVVVYSASPYVRLLVM